MHMLKKKFDGFVEFDVEGNSRKQNREKNKGPLIKNEGEFSFDEFSLVARRDTKTIFSTIYISIGGN